MEPMDKYFSHTHSYLALRKAVGWIGILLPIVLMFGVFLLFEGDLIQKSISYYYHTGMRDVLVGALCAIGLFLFFYSGYDKWDDWAGNIAGFFAIGIAWFPGAESGPGNWISKIHFICATVFFLILAVYSLFLFTKKGPDPTPQKKKRNIIYIVCGLVMIACLIALMVYFILPREGGSESPFVFLAESIALIAFGISWLTKGGALYPDK